MLDGDYRGVYLVMEKIKRDKNRVDISRLDPEDVSGDRLTGGYIIKIDREAGEENDGWDSEFTQSTRRVRYLYHYPKPFDIVEEQKAYIRNFVHKFELLMNGADWKSSYLEYFNLEEFIDYWIINELTRNVDAYSLSTFLHKDRDSMGGKLVFGPVWDYNLGFGNVNYYTGEETAGLMLERKVALSDKIPFWLANFSKDEEIKRRFADRWFVLRRDVLSLERIYSIIDEWVVQLDEAQKRNFERWRILGQYVWPNNFVGDTYEEEIAYLKHWIRDRVTWLDGYLTTQIATISSNEDRGFYLGQNYPNPFNGKTTIPFYLPTSGSVVIEFFDMLGRRLDVWSYGDSPAGSHRIVFDAGVFSSGQYFYRLRTDRETESKAMQVVK